MMRWVQGSFALVLWLAACAVSGDAEPGAGVNASTMLTDGDPDACEQDCDSQVAAGCERMPPDYAMACKLLCAGLRSSTPEQCQAALRAQSQCAVDRVMYSCRDGIVAAMPQGICGREALVCASCRGSLCIPGL